MANQRVTDLDPIVTLPDSGIIHVVDTTNNAQDPAGSSFKITKENLLKENTAAILLNTAKLGVTPAQATAITNNTNKVGITTDQAVAIVAGQLNAYEYATAGSGTINNDNSVTGTGTGGSYLGVPLIFSSRNHFVANDSVIRSITLRTKSDISDLTVAQKTLEIYSVKIPVLGGVDFTVNPGVRLVSGVLAGTNTYILPGDLFVPAGSYLIVQGRSVLFATLSGAVLQQLGTTTTFANTTLTFSFVSFPALTLAVIDNLKNISNNASQIKLTGKKISILGDSVSSFTGVAGSSNSYYPVNDVATQSQLWWGRLLTASGATLNRLSAYGGGKVFGNTIDSLSFRFGELFSSGTSGNAPDIVFIFGGINDFISNTQIVLGSSADGFASNTISFASAYGYTLNKVQTTYPNAKIYCITPARMFNYNITTSLPQTNQFGVKLSQFVDVIKDVAQIHNCQVIDLFNGTNLNTVNKSNFLIDGLHPKSLGFELFNTFIFNEVNRYF